MPPYAYFFSVFGRMVILIMVLIGGYQAPAQSFDLSTDKAALEALYHATSGDNWNDNTNWLISDDISEWYGVTVQSERVRKIELRFNGLVGTLPAETWNLTGLTWLDLVSNELSGTIPPEIINLPNLERLQLTQNQFSGEIPAEIWQLTQLSSLELGGNQLTGEIPDEIDNLKSLSSLELHGNSFNGEILSLITNLENLSNLSLGNNNFTGEIPSEIVNLSTLRHLSLDVNQFSGIIPVNVFGLANLETLTLGNNEFSGLIPPEIGQLSQLRVLWLGENQLTGNIPEELTQLTELESLGLSDNQLTGPLPTTIHQLTNLGHVSILRNELTGELPPRITELKELESLLLSGNLFSGTVPDDLVKLEKLDQLWLDRNQFEGAIPELPQSLTTLALTSNYFDQLPDLSQLPLFDKLTVFDNRFTYEDLEPNLKWIDGSLRQKKFGSFQSVAVNLGENIRFGFDIERLDNNLYQWEKDGIDIPSAPSPELLITNVTVDDLGIYKLKVTNSVVTGVTLVSRNVSLTLEGVVTSIVDEAEASLLTYPNPVTDRLNFVLPESLTGEIELYLHSLTGQKVPVNIEVDKTHISLITSSLPQGFYFYQLLSGSRSFTGSFIKK